MIYQISAMDYKNHTRQSMDAAIFFLIKPKKVRFNGALRHTAEACRVGYRVTHLGRN